MVMLRLISAYFDGSLYPDNKGPVLSEGEVSKSRKHGMKF
jgi:hypothetical protein